MRTLAWLLLLLPLPVFAAQGWLDETLGWICVERGAVDVDSGLVALPDARGFVLDLRAWVEPPAAELDSLLRNILVKADDRLFVRGSDPFARPVVMLADTRRSALYDELDARRLIRVLHVAADPAFVCGDGRDRTLRRARRYLTRMVVSEQKRAHDHIQWMFRE